MVSQKSEANEICFGCRRPSNQANFKMQTASLFPWLQFQHLRGFSQAMWHRYQHHQRWADFLTTNAFWCEGEGNELQQQVSIVPNEKERVNTKIEWNSSTLKYLTFIPKKKFGVTSSKSQPACTINSPIFQFLPTTCDYPQRGLNFWIPESRTKDSNLEYFHLMNYDCKCQFHGLYRYSNWISWRRLTGNTRL